MAGIAGVPSAVRGRRALDAALNLVPFIDLLSCCIAFLLITAVWTTLARVDVANSGSGAVEAAATTPTWTLELGRDGWTLRAPDGARLAATRASLPSLLRVHAVAEPLVVRAADGVAYATVIDAIDGARSADIRIVSLGGDD